MPTKTTRVWVWLWPHDMTAFVFTGDDFEPARRWRSRSDHESQLNDKLRSLPRQPATEDKPPYGLDLVMHAKQARAVLTAMVRRLVKDGYRILAARDRDSHCGGHQKKKPCFVPTPWGLSWFPSVSAAARALQVDSSTISHKLSNPYNHDYVWDTPELSELNQQLTDALRAVMEREGGRWEGSPRELWATWAADIDTYGSISSRWKTPIELCKSLSVRCNQLFINGIHVTLEGKDRITIEDCNAC